MSSISKLKSLSSNLDKPYQITKTTSDISHEPVPEKSPLSAPVKEKKQVGIFKKKDSFEKVVGYRVGSTLNERINKFCKKNNITLTEFHTTLVTNFLDSNE